MTIPSELDQLSPLGPPVRLAVALTDAGAHPGAWREPGVRPRELFTLRRWADLVAEAERGGLDLITFEDSVRLQPGGADRVRGRLDAILLATALAPRSRGIGLVAQAPTTVTEPLLVSSQIATLDIVSGGRGGWLVDVPLHPGDGGYVGPRPVPAPAERFAEAAEHVEAVRRLWDSWEDDAEIRDAATHRFLDRAKVHAIDFEGEHLSVRGPSITPRPPQGQPLVAAADARFTGEADLRFVAAETPPDGAAGLTFADLLVVLDDNARTAIARHARLDDAAAPAFAGPTFTGTPAALADHLLALAAAGFDGARLHPAVLPHDLERISRGVVPRLQAAGALRSAGERATLRERLGLPRPANRYAAS